MSKKINNNEFKAILLGESGTGKTSLINVSVGLKFKDGIASTLASSYVMKKFNKDNQEYILDLWDTNGQEKYRAMTKLFIKNSSIVVFVYSTDNRESFENLKFWVQFVKEILGENITLGVVGNKSDLYMKEEVKEIEGKNYADNLGAKFKLVSAKIDAQGFVDFLSELLDEFLEKKGIINQNGNKENKGFKVNKNKKNKENNKCC